MSAVVLIPIAVTIHFPNGETKNYSRRNWNWDIGHNEITLWKKDMSMKIKYSGNIVIEEIFAPKREKGGNGNEGSGAR